MADGDDAIAAGFPIVVNTDKVRDGAKEITKTRDLVAQTKALIPNSKAAARAAAGIFVVSTLPGTATDGDIYLLRKP